MNKISFSPEAWEDYIYWQTQDRKTFKRAEPVRQHGTGTCPVPDGDREHGSE